MPNQFQLQQYTPEQSQQSIDEIRRLVTEAELPAELLVEIGQWAQQVIQDKQKFPEFQAWLKSKGLPDSEIPDKPDYQELASMAAMGEAVKDMVPAPAAEAEGPVAPIAPEQMSQVAAAGRNGDTQLAHINAEEAAMLKQMGGTGTINPATGLPEYGFFSDLWKGIKKVVKVVAPYALPIIALTMPALIPAIGTSLGASAALAPVVGSAVIAGGATALTGGSLKQVLSSAALTGLGSYLTPVLGKYAGGLTGIDSPTIQSMLGSAIFSGSVVAARGGTVAQILTAAATGGAASYLGQIATNAINSAKITNPNISQKAFDDAVFLAADAKGLADAGIGKNQMLEILAQTGASPAAVNQAVTSAIGGATADEIAIALSNSAGANKTLYNNNATGAEKSIIGGGNVSALESVQRAEDALFVTKDAQNLKAAGLNQSQIEMNLRAAGVEPHVASMAASEVMRGATTDAIAQSVVYSAKTYAPTNMFGEPQQFTTATGDQVAARELGSEPTTVTTKAQLTQQNYTNALNSATTDYSTGTTAGDIDFAIADAKQLYAQGLRGTQIADVLKASGMSDTMANYLGSNANVADSYLKYDLANYARTTPIYQVAPPPPVVESTQPTTPAQPTTPVAPTAPPVVDTTTNTTTQTFDDGSVLVTDTTTGQVVSATDTAGKVITPTVPTAPTAPAQPTAAQPTGGNTDAVSARVRAENLLRMNPDFTAKQVQNFLIGNGYDATVAANAANSVLGISVAPTQPTQPTQPTAPTTPEPVAPTQPTASAQPTGNTDIASARIRAENVLRMNPDFTAEQVQKFLVGNGYDATVASSVANNLVTTSVAPPTTTQTFDDGSQLTTNTQTGQVTQATPGTDVVAPNPVAPTTPTTPTTSGTPTLVSTEKYGINGLRYVYSDGSAYVKNPYGDIYQTQSAGGEYIGATKVAGLPVATAPVTPTPEPTPVTPTPEPTPAPTEPVITPTTPPVTEVTPPTTTTPEIDVSTNVQVFDDGSILVTNGSGQVIGVVDNTGASDNLTVTNFDDGSVLISDSQGEPLGGVDTSGNTFNINNQGNAVYQDTQTPISQPSTPVPPAPPGTPEIDVNGVGQTPPTTPPVVPPTTDSEYADYGDDYSIDITGGTPVEPPPVVVPPEVIDNIVHSDTEKPIEPETPVDEVPYVPPYVPPEPETPTKPPQGTYVPAAPDPRWLGRLPLPGLNPGWMEEGVRPMYATTSPVQSQYYWGNQPAFQTLEGLRSGYNAIQNVPQQPWGVHQGWWQQPMVDPGTYSYDMTPGPIAPQGQLPGYYGTPNVDYTQLSQRYVPTVPQLTPISEYKLSKGQYYDASGKPVAG